VHPEYMDSLEQSVVVFGARDPALPQKTRSCAYAVITNQDGLIAAVRNESGNFILPGGGIEQSETAAEALRREVREELGCDILLTGGIGHALQHFKNDGHSLAMHAAFYTGILGDNVQTHHEHELEWVPADRLYHPCQSWAARKHLAAQAGRNSDQRPATPSEESARKQV
jgi:8-oxo-dGTP diphosphatase